MRRTKQRLIGLLVPICLFGVVLGAREIQHRRDPRYPLVGKWERETDIPGYPTASLEFRWNGTFIEQAWVAHYGSTPVRVRYQGRYTLQREQGNLLHLTPLKVWRDQKPGATPSFDLINRVHFRKNQREANFPSLAGRSFRWYTRVD